MKERIQICVEKNKWGWDSRTKEQKNGLMIKWNEVLMNLF